MEKFVVSVIGGWGLERGKLGVKGKKIFMQCEGYSLKVFESVVFGIQYIQCCITMCSCT